MCRFGAMEDRGGGPEDKRRREDGRRREDSRRMEDKRRREDRRTDREDRREGRTGGAVRRATERLHSGDKTRACAPQRGNGTYTRVGARRPARHSEVSNAQPERKVEAGAE
jgi:hypothetical protein